MQSTYVNITSSTTNEYQYGCANNHHLNMYLKLSIFVQQT